MSQDGFVLKEGKESFVKDRNLWIFSGAIEKIPPSYQKGHIYPVYSKSGERLGSAYFNMDLSLAGRLVAFGEEDPLKALLSHLDDAIDLRDKIFNPLETNGYRLVNGEGDFLPGLIIDQYGDFLVMQSGTLGIDLLLPLLSKHLWQKNRWKGIFEKSTASARKEENLPNRCSSLYGINPKVLPMMENKILYQIHWEEGQKTGFFLDQREMRSLVQTMSQGKSVLNCFCYTGGFSLAALKGGASKVDSIDISKSALEIARAQFSLNGFTNQNLIESDVFDFLTNESLEYDLVILDPPAFAKKRKDIQNASNAYRQINRLSLAKMPKNSFLLTASCSYYIDEVMLQTLLFQAALEAGREVQILSKHRSALDHPINLSQREPGYLKSFLVYVK